MGRCSARPYRFHKLCPNVGQQERIRGRKGISMLLVDRRAVLSPRPNVKGSTRKRGPGPPHHPRVTHLVSHPSSSLSGEVQGAGRGLHGRTGRATIWRHVDLSKFESTENQPMLLYTEELRNHTVFTPPSPASNRISNLFKSRVGCCSAQLCRVHKLCLNNGQQERI